MASIEATLSLPGIASQTEINRLSLFFSVETAGRLSDNSWRACAGLEKDPCHRITRETPALASNTDQNQMRRVKWIIGSSIIIQPGGLSKMRDAMSWLIGPGSTCCRILLQSGQNRAADYWYLHIQCLVVFDTPLRDRWIRGGTLRPVLHSGMEDDASRWPRLLFVKLVNDCSSSFMHIYIYYCFFISYLHIIFIFVCYIYICILYLYLYIVFIFVCYIYVCILYLYITFIFMYYVYILQYMLLFWLVYLLGYLFRWMCG